MNKTVREVLDKFAYRVQNLMGRNLSEEIDRALSDIEKIILPEKKEYMIGHMSHTVFDCSDCGFKTGYNACLEDIKARVR